MKTITSIALGLIGIASWAQAPPSIAVDWPSQSQVMTQDLPETPCTFMTESTEEDGFGTNYETFVMADNYYVNPGEIVNIETLIIPFYTPSGNDIASANIKIHADVSGFPGAVLEFFSDIVPVSQIVLESFPNGNDLHEVTFDLSSSTLDLSGGASGQNYWIAINTTAVTGIENQAWEATSTITNQQAVFSFTSGGTWVLLISAGIDYEFVMKVEANCLLSNGADINLTDIRLYPNPSNGPITISGLDLSGATVTITNISGAKISEKIVANQQLDVSELPNGLYFLNFSVEGKSLVRKIIKQ